MHAALLMGLLCCRPEPLDSVPPAPTDSSSDTGGGALADARLEQLGQVTCADPGARASDGPFFVADGGPDWGQQVVEPAEPRTSKGRGVVVADLDGDGLLDIYLPNMGPDQLYLQRDDLTWEDATSGRLPALELRTQGASAVDIDDDGDLDILQVNRGDRNLVLLNDGHANFTAGREAGLAAQEAGSTGSSWADIDGDGDLDLLVIAHFVGPSGDWSSDAPGPGDPAELYENLGGGRFRDLSDLLPDDALYGYTYSGGLHDLDRDGDPDLYFVNDFGSTATPNLLYLNTLESGGFGIVDDSDASGAGVAVFGMSLGLGDLNGDELPDMLVTSWDNLVLLESAGPDEWFDSAAGRGLVADVEAGRDVAWGADLADLDDDGDLDAFIAYGYLAGGEEPGLGNPEKQPDALYVQQDDGSFVQEAEAWGVADDGIGRGYALADLNRDGYLDIVERELDGPARILLSRCGDASWLEVRLSQPPPNTGAVGAVVEVEAGGRRQVRTVRVGGTNLSSSSPTELHFGLGDAGVVDRLKVNWPDGQVSVFEQVPPRQRVRVERLDG